MLQTESICHGWCSSNVSIDAIKYTDKIVNFVSYFMGTLSFIMRKAKYLKQKVPSQIVVTVRKMPIRYACAQVQSLFFYFLNFLINFS